MKDKNKEYRAIMVEKKTAEKLKKSKPVEKTMTQFIEELLSPSLT